MNNGMEGTPWDFQRVRVAEAALRDEGKDIQPLSMATVVDIYSAGNQVAYTNDARNMLAKEAIMALSQLKPDEDVSKKLEEVIAKVNDMFPKS